MSELEMNLAFQIKVAGLPKPETEYKFALAEMGRQWRSDFAFVEQRILVEVEGGAYVSGRHTRGSGFTKDCIKYNAAAVLGYAVLRFTRELIESGEALVWIERMLAQRVEEALA